MQQAKLYLPAFTKGKDQLSALEIEQTRNIANVRIHVDTSLLDVFNKNTLSFKEHYQ